MAAPTGPARQPENSDIRPKEINEYFKWHARMGHAGSDHLLKTIQTVNDINKNIEIDKNKCVICIFNKMMKMMNKLLFLWIIKLLKRIFSNFWKKYRIINIKNKKHFLFFMNNYLKMSIIYIYDKNKTKQQLNAYKNNMKKQIEKIFQHIHNNNVKKFYFKIIIIYTFKQNEMTKKLNRIFITTTKKMLLWSNLFEMF